MYDLILTEESGHSGIAHTGMASLDEAKSFFYMEYVRSNNLMNGMWDENTDSVWLECHTFWHGGRPWAYVHTSS